MIASAKFSSGVNNERSMQLTGRNYLSVSAVKQFLRCPLSYRFKYIDRIPEETVSSALAFGRGIHAALELWFTAQLEGQPEPTLEELLVMFWDEWKACEQETSIRLGKNEDITKIADMAQRMIAAFIASSAAHPAGQVVGIEEELRAALLVDAPDVLGRLDLVIETPDAFIVIDFKTAKSKWSDAQRQDAELQAIVYKDLAGQLAGNKPVRVEFVVLTKTKTPSVSIEPVAVTEPAIRRGKAMMSAAWQAIQNGNFYPSPSITACPSCPYRNRCDAWQG